LADLTYIRSNKLSSEAAAPKEKTQRQILWITIPLAVVCLYFQVLLALAVLIIGGFLYFQVKPDAQIAAGAQGEDIALSILKPLPDQFVIFNQMDIPNDKSGTGVNEADFIVVGPSAIFVVEIKNNSGTILCDESAKNWNVAKVGRGGTSYEGKEVRNPEMGIFRICRRVACKVFAALSAAYRARLTPRLSADQDSAVKPTFLINGPQRSSSSFWLRAMSSTVPP
jgi:Nuclease-related domain